MISKTYFVVDMSTEVSMLAWQSFSTWFAGNKSLIHIVRLQILQFMPLAAQLIELTCQQQLAVFLVICCPLFVRWPILTHCTFKYSTVIISQTVFHVNDLYSGTKCSAFWAKGITACFSAHAN